MVFLLGSVVLTHRWIREPYVFSRVELDFLATGTRVFGDTKVRQLIVAYTSGIFVMQAVIGFLPLFLQAEQNFSATLSSAGFAVLFVGAMITMPVSGSLGDRFSYVPVAVGGLVLSLIGLVVLIFASSVVVVLLGVLCFGLGIWAFPPVIQAHLMTRFPDDSMGGDYGVFKTVYAGVGSLGPAYVGFVAGLFDYTSAFLGLIVFLVVAIVIFSRL